MDRWESGEKEREREREDEREKEMREEMELFLAAKVVIFSTVMTQDHASFCSIHLSHFFLFLLPLSLSLKSEYEHFIPHLSLLFPGQFVVQNVDLLFPFFLFEMTFSPHLSFEWLGNSSFFRSGHFSSPNDFNERYQSVFFALVPLVASFFISVSCHNTLNETCSEERIPHFTSDH